MKLVSVRSMIFLVGILAASFTASAEDSREFSSNLDEAACDENGQCVVFEVQIKLSSTTSTPIVKETEDSLSVGGTTNPYGSVVTRSGNACSKHVRVPRDVFFAIITIMRSLADEGNQPPAFTPAQQTILLFYTTLMQQTMQFQCTSSDLAGGQRM